MTSKIKKKYLYKGDEKCRCGKGKDDTILRLVYLGDIGKFAMVCVECKPYYIYPKRRLIEVKNES